jgi:hypothetical protein
MYFITYVDRVNIAEGSSRKPFPLSLAQGSGDFGTVRLTFARPRTPARPFVARLSRPIGVYKILQLRGSRSKEVPFVQRTFSGSNAAKLEGLRWVSKIKPDFNFAL